MTHWIWSFGGFWAMKKRANDLGKLQGKWRKTGLERGIVRHLDCRLVLDRQKEEK
jgi:hypothetical protein